MDRSSTNSTSDGGDTENSGVSTLKAGFLNTLQQITAVGSFAHSARFKNFPSLGLQVNGVGNVALPLSKSDAQKLIAHARQAPYGKGSETLVDTTVRNTWELDAADFSFTDPQWEKYLKSICHLVAESLGVGTTVRAEIYKMLLYEKGAMFKAHTDTEKIPGMFGTLVICLPSPHEGGDVILKLGGKQQMFKSSAGQPSMACWYADVSHEVLPVTSGYRWVLTYNLAIDPAQPRPTAATQQSQLQPLIQEVSRWTAQEPAARSMKWVYYVLDHNYTQANASLRMLKRRDQAVVQALKDLSKTVPLDVFLALLEKQEMGPCDYDEPYGYHRPSYYYGEVEDDNDDGVDFHGLTEVFEVDYRVKNLIDLDGRTVMKDLQLDEDEVLQDDCFEDLDAEEDFEGYMGNSGPSATHWYRTTAVVIVPRDSLLAYFNRPDRSSYGGSKVANIPGQVRYLARACLESGATKQLSAALWQLCQQAWKSQTQSTGPIIDSEGIHMIMKLAIIKGNSRLLKATVENHYGALSTDFFKWLRNWLVAQDDVEGKWNGMASEIMTSFLCYHDFTKMLSSLNVFAPVPGRPEFLDDFPTPNCVLATVRSSLVSIVDTFVEEKFLPMSHGNGQVMVDLALYHEDPLEFVSEVMIEKLLGKVDNPALILGFLDKLHTRGQNGAFPIETTQALYRDIAKGFIAKADFTSMRNSSSTKQDPQLRLYNRDPIAAQRTQKRNDVNASELHGFFMECHYNSTESDDLVKLLIPALINYMPKAHAAEFHSLWLPFLRGLFLFFTSKQPESAVLRYQQLSIAILKAYGNQFVGCQPVGSLNYARGGVSCRCSDCERLNRFLAHTTQMQGLFPVSKSRRHHLHQMIEISNVNCKHETNRSTRPETLVVTKNLRGNQLHRQEWRTRLTKAIQELKSFDQPKLQALLGDEYEAIVGLTYLFAEPAGAGAAFSQKVLSQISENQSRPTASSAGQKRKRQSAEPEVIDLTSD